MPTVRDFLERLRPSGTPGTAARSGVPADRVAELSAELAPVLAVLDEAQERAERIRAAGTREAQQRRDAAAARARALVEHARLDADAERRAAAAAAQAQAVTDARRRMDEAVRQAEIITAAADRRRADFVDMVVSQARTEIDRLVGGEP